MVVAVLSAWLAAALMLPLGSPSMSAAGSMVTFAFAARMTSPPMTVFSPPCSR